MKKQFLILVSGYKQSGKDVLGKYLVDNYNFRKLSFATWLKDLSAGFLNILTGGFYSAEMFDDNEMKKAIISFKYNKKNRTYRELLQYVGSDWVREFFNDDLWAEQIADRLQHTIRVQHTIEDVIITDWRFPNEYKVLKDKLEEKYNIITIRINRFENNEDMHISETALDDFVNYDYVIENKDTLEEYENSIKKVISNLF